MIPLFHKGILTLENNIVYKGIGTQFLLVPPLFFSTFNYGQIAERIDRLAIWHTTKVLMEIYCILETIVSYLKGVMAL